MKRVQRNFRPSDENQERLAYAEKLGINPADIINEALRVSAKKIIEEKAKKLRETLSVPVP